MATRLQNLLIGALVLGATPMMASSSAVAASMKHGFIMRGMVVDKTNGVATVCIGKADGAAPGQTLNVVRVIVAPGTKGNPSMRRVNVGKVRIDSIVDDHFARAKVVSGEVALHDLVELE